jgi:hypothetical protein
MTNDYYAGAATPRVPTVSEVVNENYAQHPRRRDRSLDSTIPSWRKRFLAYEIGRMIAGFFNPW